MCKNRLPTRSVYNKAQSRTKQIYIYLYIWYNLLHLWIHVTSIGGHVLFCYLCHRVITYWLSNDHGINCSALLRLSYDTSCHLIWANYNMLCGLSFDTSSADDKHTHRESSNHFKKESPIKHVKGISSVMRSCIFVYLFWQTSVITFIFIHRLIAAISIFQ